MDIERTVAVINQMLADGVMENYALGGAVAAIFYTEPIDTQDVDIFVQVKGKTTDLTMLSPIYDYLLKRGYQTRAEHIYIKGFPVQFLPTFNALTEEAVAQAQEFELDTVRMRVMRPEHLVALMLDTGRAKDYLRINMFLQMDAVNRERLQSVLQRHGLSQKWAENEYRFRP
jgi:predicted nucleotidyltransferase